MFVFTSVIQQYREKVERCGLSTSCRRFKTPYARHRTTPKTCKRTCLKAPKTGLGLRVQSLRQHLFSAPSRGDCWCASELKLMGVDDGGPQSSGKGRTIGETLPHKGVPMAKRTERLAILGTVL